MNELPEGEFVNDHERSEGDNGRGVIRLKPYTIMGNSFLPQYVGLT